MDALKAKLMAVASETAWDDEDDFCVDDYSGGNQDDAFYGGKMAGKIDLARALLSEFFAEKPPC